MRKLLLVILYIFIVATHVKAQLTLKDAFPALTFTQPIELLSSPDGTNRIFVVSQKGTISVFPNNQDVTAAQTFLDIGSRMVSGGEMGLLGMAFHPDYKNNGYFYVNYTRNNSSLETVIARFKVSATNPNEADPASELILLTFAQPYSNHNGGKLAFGPDGYLYIASGDGGSGGDPHNNGQNLKTLLGKLLRIDVNTTASGLNYGIPTDNPFANNTEGNRHEIYAYGLRNPWKFSFDEPTGNLWLADVGQGNREEIDIVEKGGNYGWRITEGNACYNPAQNCNTTGLIAPVFDYGRTEGISITGGYVYRGQIPYLQGKYIYGDFGSKNIWALTYANGAASNEFLLKSNGAISSFGEDQFKELYVCSHGNGKIYKFSDDAVGTPTNLAATAPTEGGIVLTWTDNSYNETGFIIERSQTATGPFTSIDTVATNTTTFTDNNLTPNTSYFYRIKAYNATTRISSAYTPVVTITTQKLNQRIVFTTLSDKLTTDAAFRVTATASSNLPVTFTVVSGPATITDNNLVTLTGKGKVVIRASQPGDYSYNAALPIEQSFTVGTPEETSMLITPSNGTTGISTAPLLTCKVAQGATKYIVELNTKEDFSGTARIDSSTTATIKYTGLDTSTVYYARVRTSLLPKLWGQTTSFKTAGSESLSYIINPAEGAIDVSLTPQLESKAITGATQYIVELSTKPDFSENKLSATNTTSTSTFTGLDSNTIYYARVQTDVLPQLWGKVVSFKTIVSAITALPEQLKKEFGLIVFPNPASQFVTIQFTLKSPSKVNVTLMDVYGRPVGLSLNDRYFPNGKQELVFNTSSLNTGFYTYKLTINSKVVTGKFQIIK